MIGTIREAATIIRDLDRRVARAKAERVSREDFKTMISEVVEGYFRTDRPILLRDLHDEGLFSQLDPLMQELLRLTHRRSPKARYLQVLRSIQTAWHELEVVAMPLAPKLTGDQPRIGQDQEDILRTLEQISPAAANCYRQALTDLQDSSRTSWRGAATELREALRELLDALAPDDVVTASPGFKLETGTRGPTMRQKARFILRSRRVPEGARKPVEDALDVVEDSFGRFVRSVYTRSSVSVHGERGKREVLSILRFVETAFAELLEL